MNNIQIIGDIPCYEKDGVAYLKLETVARGLGFTEKAASGNKTIRWRTVNKYLSELGIAASCDDFIPENIFYRLAMKAKNEAAERFQAKVADEIIPTIRKTGGYVSNTDHFIESYFPQLRADQKSVIGMMLDESKRMGERLKEQAPKVLFADAVTASRTSILVGELAKLIQQNGVEIGQKRLFEWMRNNGYLLKRGSEYNMPSQNAMEMGLFEIKETAIAHSDGHTTVSRTPKVTGRGQAFFVNKFLAKVETQA